MPPLILELASQDSHGFFLIYLCLLISSDIPFSLSASSAVPKETVEHEFPRKNNSCLALQHKSQPLRKSIDLHMISTSFCIFPGGPGSTGLSTTDQFCLCQMKLSICQSESQRVLAALCHNKAHAYQSGTHRKFIKKRKRNSYIGLKHHACKIVAIPFYFHLESARRVTVLYSVLQLQLQVVNQKSIIQYLNTLEPCC